MDQVASMERLRQLARERMEGQTIDMSTRLWPALQLGDTMTVTAISHNDDGTIDYTLRKVSSTSATPSTASTASGNSENPRPRSPDVP